MRLLRDLWATSTRRMAIVACLIVSGPRQAGAAALAGAVLVHRAAGFFALYLAAAGRRGPQRPRGRAC